LRLKVPAGVRPAAERVRQAIFGSLGHRVEGARVLDLYCGSGAYAIEALSRGAASAVGVDRDARAIKTAKANATAAELEGRASFVRRDAGAFAGAEARRRGPFDLVFCDPPYDEPACIESLLSQLSGALVIGGVVVVEQRWSAQDSAAPSSYVLEADRRYGDTRVLTYRHKGRGQG
jgi:16S rRNA (guanine966-N2)-methyltransferase